MSREKVEIRTQAGTAPAYVFRPEGKDAGAGKWPAVIFFMDGLGIRPALLDMGERLARSGYVVLLPDLFYRAGKYEPLDVKAVFASGDVRKAIGHLLGSTNNKLAGEEDTKSFLAYLDSRPDVAGKKIGTTGYCMGGAISLTAAGSYPERVAAAASFHGGSLAADNPLSPHHLANKMKGFIYVAGADKDGSYPPEMHELLEKTLSEAKVPHRCEIYEGALHGWTMPDFPVYNEAAAERHWKELTALYKRELN
jgi:carboxymethylenebutenolidase